MTKLERMAKRYREAGFTVEIDGGVLHASKPVDPVIMAQMPELKERPSAWTRLCCFFTKHPVEKLKNLRGEWWKCESCKRTWYNSSYD